MKTDKKTVIVYESFYEVVNKLQSAEDFKTLTNAMIEYGLYGIEPKFEKLELELIWTIYKPNMDANINRYNKAVESGKKGGLAKAAATQKQKVETNQQPSITENKKPIIEEQTKNDDVDNIQGIEIDEESEQDIKEPYEFYSMDDDTIPFDFLIDYYNTLKFSNQVKRVNVYGMIENGEITNKQQLLEHSTL
jgi:hypothetical protein